VTEGAGVDLPLMAASVDLPLMAAWLAARSLSRDLPAPVPDRGGVRVDTGHADERRRYVFTAPCDGLRELGLAIDEPFVALKLCRSADELVGLLPPRWAISSNSWVMGRDASRAEELALPEGYQLTLGGSGPVSHAAISDDAGDIVASGYAAETDGVFIYDRIKVDPAHERRRLGRALMEALAGCRKDDASREILTATAAGRGLYLQLGWRDLAPYTTAMIPAHPSSSP
jgi:GNAT superfamily N-acetyltransferase